LVGFEEEVYEVPSRIYRNQCPKITMANILGSQLFLQCEGRTPSPRRRSPVADLAEICRILFQTYSQTGNVTIERFGQDVPQTWDCGLN